MSRSKEEDFVKIALMLMVLAPWGAPHRPKRTWAMNLIVLPPFTHRCFMPNLVEIGFVVPEKKLQMFKRLIWPTNDEQWRKKKIANRSLQWLRWPKNVIFIPFIIWKRDSYELVIIMFYTLYMSYWYETISILDKANTIDTQNNHANCSSRKTSFYRKEKVF